MKILTVIMFLSGFLLGVFCTMYVLSEPPQTLYEKLHTIAVEEETGENSTVAGILYGVCGSMTSKTEWLLKLYTDEYVKIMLNYYNFKKDTLSYDKPQEELL